MKLLGVICVDGFIDKVKLSEARRPRYYDKSSKKPLPKRFEKGLGTKYQWVKIKQKYLLADSEGELIVSNPRAVGTAKYLPIKGNAFYSGFGSHHARQKIVAAIKEQFESKFKKIKKIDEFPVFIHFQIYDKLNMSNEGDDKKTQDVDNKFYAYVKVSLDLLTKLKKIPDDNLKYVRGYTNEFIPIEDSSKRKLVIKIYKYEELDKIFLSRFCDELKTN